MARLKFGAFLAPHHPIGEHPMLQFRRDLDFVEQETGTAHAREIDKQQAQAMGNLQLEVAKARLNPKPAPASA